MELIEITSQNRRDFRGTYKCQACGNMETNGYGYDDNYFHHQVIPTMKCKQCGKSTKDLGLQNIPRVTKYPDGMQV